jgi:NitT/TauT family transport system substrate-binding protein
MVTAWVYGRRTTTRWRRRAGDCWGATTLERSTLISRPDFAKEKPELCQYLAVYLRAWSWITANPKEAREMMKKFYAQGGVEISDQGMESEFADRPVFALDEQIKNMDRSAGKSKVDTWLGNIGEFMKSVGTIPEVPDGKTFIDDTYMKKVAADPALKAMATKSN